MSSARRDSILTKRGRFHQVRAGLRGLGVPEMWPGVSKGEVTLKNELLTA